MDDFGIMLSALFEESPLLGRAFFVSLELLVLVPLLALAVKIKLLRTYRLQSLLWLFIILNVIVGATMRAPFDVSLWRDAPPAAAPIAVSTGNVYRPALREADHPVMAAQTASPPLQDIKSLMAPPRGIAPAVIVSQAVPVWWKKLSLVEGLSLAWLGGVFLMLGYLVLQRWRLYSLLKRTKAPAPELTAQYEAEVAALNTWWRPALRVTSDLESPAIVGVLRPVILIPHWLESDGTKEQWSWTLRHELTHWCHGDTLGQMLRL
ncbi:MAG: hypothetical protein L3K26_15680, partial [Candidatus Hydrogenedentes bacterium]|nr:hypothetical protein [Candidatus Hydrogenedentota bacterium]